MKKIDPTRAERRVGSGYPAPFDEPCRARERLRLGAAAGLSRVGVNLLRLAPGAWSSQRHWHTREEEFVYVLEGEVVLVTDAGRETLRAGDAAGFRAGDPDGHHLRNESASEAVLLEVGTCDSGDVADYPDIDLRLRSSRFERKDGTPY